MPAAVNGNEFHFNLRVVAPEYLLDVKSVGHLGLARFGRADDVVEVRPNCESTLLGVAGTSMANMWTHLWRICGLGNLRFEGIASGTQSPNVRCSPAAL